MFQIKAAEKKTLVISCGLYLLSISPFLLRAQLSDTTLIFKKDNIQYFTIDPLQNLYCLDLNGQVQKYSPSGQLLFDYSNNRLGTVSYIDASDPFNILLFFYEQQMIVLLDRTLNERSRLDLRTLTTGQAVAVALSSDNNIWVYDDYEGILIQIDAHSNIQLKSQFLGFALDNNQVASHVFRWNDKVLVNFPEKGIAVFDLFAQFENWWDILGVIDGQSTDQSFVFRTKKGHFVYYPTSNYIQQIDSPTLRDCIMLRNAFSKQYILNTKGELFIYHIFESEKK